MLHSQMESNAMLVYAKMHPNSFSHRESSNCCDVAAAAVAVAIATDANTHHSYFCSSTSHMPISFCATHSVINVII